MSRVKLQLRWLRLLLFAVHVLMFICMILFIFFDELNAEHIFSLPVSAFNKVLQLLVLVAIIVSTKCESLIDNYESNKDLRDAKLGVTTALNGALNSIV